MDRQTSTRLGIGLVAGITVLLIAALFIILMVAPAPDRPALVTLSAQVTPHIDGSPAGPAVAVKPVKVEPSVPVDPKLVPGYNFALAAHGGKATGGLHPEQLIDGNVSRYDGNTGFASTQWRATPAQTFIVEFAEPSEIDCIRFLLWQLEASRFYRFKLEVGTTPENWTMLQDRSAPDQQCKGWQEIHFAKQKVKFVRLTGTFNSVNRGFHVVELQACIAPPHGFPPDPGVLPPTPNNVEKVDLEF